MAANQLNSAQQRRKMLGDSSAQLGQAGLDYFEAGRLGEALECLRAVRDTEGLSRIAQAALENGDFWAYGQAVQAAGLQPDPAQVEKLISRAKELGKDAFARAAEKSLNHSDRD